MQENNSTGVGTAVVLTIVAMVAVYFIFGIGKYEGETAEHWYTSYEESQSQIEDYKTALQEANDNIENVNSAIEDAKYYSGESYDEMVDALDSIESAETVSDPH